MFDQRRLPREGRHEEYARRTTVRGLDLAAYFDGYQRSYQRSFSAGLTTRLPTEHRYRRYELRHDKYDSPTPPSNFSACFLSCFNSLVNLNKRFESYGDVQRMERELGRIKRNPAYQHRLASPLTTRWARSGFWEAVEDL